MEEQQSFIQSLKNRFRSFYGFVPTANSAYRPLKALFMVVMTPYFLVESIVETCVLVPIQIVGVILSAIPLVGTLFQIIFAGIYWLLGKLFMVLSLLWMFPDMIMEHIVETKENYDYYHKPASQITKEE